jgi:pilus assembly protein CpaC
MSTAHSNRVRKVPALFLCALLIANMAGRADGQSQMAAVPSSSDPDRPGDLALSVGKSVIVKCDVPIEKIAVGFGDIAEASAASPYEVLVDGKTAGVTSLIIWQRGGTKRFFDVRVSASTFVADTRVDAIRRELELELPGQHINLSFENETVFLRGSVKDITSADRAVAIASTLGKTVNLLYVDVPAPEAQILLKVKFASVDRNANTQLGMNLLSTGAANTIGSVTTGQFSAPAAPVVNPGSPVASTITDALNLFFFRPDLNLGATIEALQAKGLLQILSEPNVLAEDGKQSSFLAGGEFPFPSVSAGGAGGTPAVAIQFREYGVRLTFTPTITPRGTIQLQVAPEVSALDFTNGLIVSGFNVPALTTRKMSTQVELSEGQSFAIGGLLDNRTTDTLEKIPFIGDIPILGKFFQSKSVSKQNTELIVIVTPELVRPIPAGQPLPMLKFTIPFLAANTDFEPRTPGLDANGSVPVDPPHPMVPIEKLMQSLRQAAVPVPPITGSASPAGSSANNSSGAVR